MYEYLIGQLVSRQNNVLIIDVNGIGYRITVPLNEEVGQIGDEVKIYVSYTVNDEIPILYGFMTRAKREAFDMLISVSKIGPKMALSVLSSLSVENLVNAIIQGDVRLLSTVQGIGRKTAERMILELKDKIASISIVPSTGREVSNSLPSEIADAIEGLVALGYPRGNAWQAVNTVVRESKVKMDAAEIIRHALTTIRS
ncbi:MAG: Holliday junction branch migration protein RuvA [Thermotoga sp.]|nr:Holliday junction branch migration protein RuvA [Thermotogota bacterium]RKX52602.1 MAG: Holliday junction branch migration protein RuvA [Thermotoga sp.]